MTVNHPIEREGGITLSFQGDLEDFNTLEEIVARLRGPEGCPWDQAQTMLSLRTNLLEECYEVLEAVDLEDRAKVCEELGDLLLLVLLYSQIATEGGHFAIGDVIRQISTKLIHRHPHVFGDRVAKKVEEVLINWQALKLAEPGNTGKSLLEGIPRSMPALGYSQEVQRRVATVGFDWENLDGIVDKVIEEAGELKRAKGQREKEEEFGDLLFTLANLARRQGIDLESALRLANQRFFLRFSYMEEECRKRNVSFAGLPADSKESLWQEAKKATRL